MGAKTMVYGECNGVLLCVHTSEPPSQEEWEGYVDYCCLLPTTCVKTLVVTEGGGPNAAQRKVLQERYLDAQQATNGGCRVAVMTDSAMVRGVVKALNWFNRGTNSFPYLEGAGMPAALRHLDLDLLEAHRVRVEIEVMRRELARSTLTQAGATGRRRNVA